MRIRIQIGAGDPDPHVLVKSSAGIAGWSHLQQARLVLQITSKHILVLQECGSAFKLVPGSGSACG
jgi:hypothetical protein